MTCQTCKGTGHVAGHWMPELCPACSGECDVRLHGAEPSRTVPWWLVAAIVILVAIVIGAQWGLWSFLFAVFGP